MKKYAFILLMTVISAAVVVSCTEEQVVPKSPVDAPGASGSTGKF
jgi:hypothetical protein